MLRQTVRKALHPLKAYRYDEGLTQTDLADKLGISVGQLCRLERGSRGITGLMAVKIERKLGIPRNKLRPDLWAKSSRDAA